MGIFSSVRGWFNKILPAPYGEILLNVLVGVFIIGGIIIYCIVFGCGDQTSACEKFCDGELGDFSYEECIERCKEEGI